MDFEQSEQLKIAALNLVFRQYRGTLGRWLKEREEEEYEEQCEARWQIRKPIWQKELAEWRRRDPAQAAKYHRWWLDSGRPMQ